MTIVLEIKTQQEKPPLLISHVYNSLHSRMIPFANFSAALFSDWQPPEWQKYVIRLQLFCHFGSLEK